jgi:soluble cytochrome b562
MAKRIDIVKTLCVQCGVALEYVRKVDELQIYIATRQNALTIAKLKQEIEIADLQNQLEEKRNPQPKYDEMDELQHGVAKLKLLTEMAHLRAKINGIENVLSPEEQRIRKKSEVESELAQLQAGQARLLSQIDPNDEDMRMLVQNVFNDRRRRLVEELANL